MYHGPAQTESAKQSASHHARDGSESVRSQPKMEAGGQSQVPEARTRMPEPEASQNVRASGAGRGGGRWRRVPAQRCPNGEMEVGYLTLSGTN
jgi:hypothetical protein